MILDVGCGRKRLADVNLDIDPEVNPDVVADMAYLPFRDKAFYRSIFHHSFEHTSKPRETLEEAARCSQSVHIAVPNSQALMRFILTMIVAPKCWQTWKHGYNLSHKTSWTWRKVYALHPRPKIKGTAAFWSNPALRKLAKAWARIAPPLADQIELELINNQ